MWMARQPTGCEEKYVSGQLPMVFSVRLEGRTGFQHLCLDYPGLLKQWRLQSDQSGFNPERLCRRWAFLRPRAGTQADCAALPGCRAQFSGHRDHRAAHGEESFREAHHF